MAAKKKVQGGKVTIEFSKAEGGGGRVRIPEGDYIVVVDKVSLETSQSGNPMLVWKFKITDGKYKGKVLTDRTALTPKALWKVRDVLTAMGMEVPDKDVQLSLKKLHGKELGITVVDEEYEGKIYSKPSDYVEADVIRDGGVDEDDDEEEDEDEDEDDDDELEDMDLDELE